MVNGIIILLIGIGFHKLPETFLFYLAFVSLRFFVEVIMLTAIKNAFCTSP